MHNNQIQPLSLKEGFAKAAGLTLAIGGGVALARYGVSFIQGDDASKALRFATEWGKISSAVASSVMTGVAALAGKPFKVSTAFSGTKGNIAIVNDNYEAEMAQYKAIIGALGSGFAIGTGALFAADYVVDKYVTHHSATKKSDMIRLTMDKPKDTFVTTNGFVLKVA